MSEVSTYKRIDRKGHSISELAEKTGLARRTISRHTSLPRHEWLAQKAREREAIRRFHDDEGHSWTETAKHFDLHYDTVKERAYRARKERASEKLEEERQAKEINEPPLPLK